MIRSTISTYNGNEKQTVNTMPGFFVVVAGRKPAKDIVDHMVVSLSWVGLTPLSTLPRSSFARPIHARCQGSCTDGNNGQLFREVAHPRQVDTTSQPDCITPPSHHFGCGCLETETKNWRSKGRRLPVGLSPCLCLYSCHTQFPSRLRLASALWMIKLDVRLGTSAWKRASEGKPSFREEGSGG